MTFNKIQGSMRATMRWEHESVVEATVRSFCEEHLPDAHNLSDLSYSIEEGPVMAGSRDRTYQVEVDIPTSAMEAWLTFYVDCNADEPHVTGISCLRSGRGSLADHVYRWTSETGEWETVSFDD